VGAKLLPVSCRPTRLELGGSRKLHGETTELAVTSLTKLDQLPLATALSHRTRADKGLDLGGGGKAVAVIAELDQQARGQEVPGTWQ